MGRYDRELDRLASTYEAVLATDLRDLRHLVRGLAGRHVTFVASGGGLAVAQFASDLHRQASWGAADAMTPLQFLGHPPMSTDACVVISAGARHPDTALALQAAAKRGTSAALVTTQRRDRIAEGASRPWVRIAQVPSPKDGFLATNSVLAFMTALSLAYGFDLPGSLPMLAAPDGNVELRSETLVLSGSLSRCIALDFEARMSELGLLRIQYTDFRNFAHGRHAGLARRLTETTVLAVSTTDDRSIAERTLRQLPTAAHVVHIQSELDFPSGVVDLSTTSMRLAGLVAATQGLDPARPGVEPFGRKLYHLKIDSTARNEEYALPVDRKARHLGGSRGQPTVHRALVEWLRRLERQEIRAVVLDYDGTCCSTDKRFDPLLAETEAALHHVLDLGLTLAIATGRGRSLVEALRSSIPSPHWGAVHVGLYNGTVRMQLDEDIEVELLHKPSATMQQVAERIHQLREFTEIEIEPRISQVTATSSMLSGSDLRLAIQALLARDELGSQVNVTASAHSVDIVEGHLSKDAIVEMLRDRTGGEVLAIGDQGQPGGNDFQLLAATATSLSVDRCSADLTRCWNLGGPGEAGPELLVRYLTSLTASGDGKARLHWGNRA